MSVCVFLLFLADTECADGSRSWGLDWNS